MPFNVLNYIHDSSRIDLLERSENMKDKNIKREKQCLNYYINVFIVVVLISLLLPVNVFAQEHYRVGGFGSDFAPFNFSDEKGKEIGIDRDIMEAIEKDQAFTVEKIDMPFNSALQALEQGQVDAAMAAMSITDERKKIYDFSDPYYESSTSFAVNDSSDIKNLEDLRGKKVAVKTGAMGSMVARDHQNEYGYEIVEFEDSTSMYQAVMGGNADAVVDETPVMQYAISTGRVKLRLIGEPFEAAPLGVAVPKGQNKEFLDRFNQGLTNIRNDGTYDKIIESYLGNEALEQNKSSNSLLEQLVQFWPQFMSGLKVTVMISIISIVLAMVFGTILGIFKDSDIALLRGIATIYIDLIRGIPMIVLAFFVYFGIPQYTGTKVPEIIAGIITVTLNATAYIAEIVRGGIQGVNKGEVEAARSLGLSHLTTMRKIILPQAFRLMIPSLINQFVISLKDTSILSVIGIVELTQAGKIIIARTYKSGDVWMIVGLMYFVIITILTKVSNRIERHLKKGY